MPRLFAKFNLHPSVLKIGTNVGAVKYSNHAKFGLNWLSTSRVTVVFMFHLLLLLLLSHSVFPQV